MTKRVDLQDQPDAEFFPSRSSISRSRIGLPVAVAGEIVVGNEKPRDALRRIGAHDRLDVVGGAVTRFAALDIDDGAEAALERAAPAGVEAGICVGTSVTSVAREDRRHRARRFGHVVDIVVDRLGRAGCDLAQHIAHAAFGLAGEQMNAEIQRFLHIGRHFRQHREAAADMKAAHDDRHAQRRGIAGRDRARAETGWTGPRQDRPCRRRLCEYA